MGSSSGFIYDSPVQKKNMTILTPGTPFSTKTNMNMIYEPVVFMGNVDHKAPKHIGIPIIYSRSSMVIKA